MLDPPDHTRIKKLLVGAFVPAKVDELEAPTRQLVVDLIDKFADRGFCDAADDFARRIPVAVMCRLLDLPPEDEGRFSAWVHQIVDGAADADAVLGAGLEMAAYFGSLVERRRPSPGQDLISLLLTAEVDGEHLSDLEVILSSVTLLLAGIDTTWSMVGASLLHLARHPDDQERLRRDPSLLPTACEEFLRAYAPVTIAREVTRQVEFRGFTLAPGDMVLVPFPSACLDEDRFDNADQVLIDRQPNPHVAFGIGVHRCLGANLGRMELRVALEEFLRRIPPFRVADETGVRWSSGQTSRPPVGPRRLRAATVT